MIHPRAGISGGFDLRLHDPKLHVPELLFHSSFYGEMIASCLLN